MFRRRAEKLFLYTLPLLFFACLPAEAGETDQYLTWTVELEDSAPALNAYLNEEIEAFVEKMNRRNDKVGDPAELTAACFQHLFGGLFASRLRNWLKNAEEVDRFPSDGLSDWEYQRMSVLREPAFPFILPMAQTIRVGDVYLGIDKIGHMFGFGRRYVQRYHRHRDAGDSHDEALDRVLAWGLRQELTLVGKLVDGIFSHADLEANYQGFRLARALYHGPDALFYRDGDAWRYRGGLDIRDFVTPDMDESYNTNHYAGWRARLVDPIVEERYAPLEETDAVRDRFRRYARDYAPSRSKRFVDAWFERDRDDSGALARK